MMIDETKARYYGWSVVFASWLAVFCLFGFRATFAILEGPMAITLGWTAEQVTLGYSLMMVFYAVVAYFSGMMLDKWGTKPVYAVAAVFGCLGFMLTARVDTHLAYLFTFGLLGGVATGMLWVASTVSVRKWFVGDSYATMWGFAFAGGPMAQFVLAELVKPTLSASQAKLDLAIRPLVENNAALVPKQLALAIAAKLRDPDVLALPAVKDALGGLEHAWRHQIDPPGRHLVHRPGGGRTRGQAIPGEVRHTALWRRPRRPRNRGRGGAGMDHCGSLFQIRHMGCHPHFPHQHDGRISHLDPSRELLDPGRRVQPREGHEHLCPDRTGGHLLDADHG
jgi:hypothetical protein